MFPVALIVFREVLEIALIVSVIIVASSGRAGRGLWTCIGLAGGAAGAGIIALFAEALTRAAEGMGQEIFNAMILFAAATLIGLTAVWMRTHAREAAAHLKSAGVAVREGRLPLYTLATVTALAVWREGSEIVLFLYGMAISGEAASAIIGGAALGLAGGALVGFAMYKGMLKVAARHVFGVTGWLLVLLSAGMASQGMKLLADADMIQHFTMPVWNTSALLPEKSLLGQALHALLGYSAQPLGIQVITYVAVVSVLLAIMQMMKSRPAQPKALAV